MPQFTEFPPLPPGEAAKAVDAFIGVLRALPPEGEPFRAFRRRLKAAEVWSRERLDQLLRFLQMAQDDPIRPSGLVARVVAGDDAAARTVLAERLFAINPLLFATVFERLQERIHSVNELLKYIDSFAYPGVRVTGPEVRAWIRLAEGLGLFRNVGIRLGLTDAALEAFAPRVKAFDVEEFLEDDAEEDAAEPAPPPTTAPTSSDPQPAPPPAPAASAPARAAPSFPHDGWPRIPVRRFAADIAGLGEQTVDRLTSWWSEHATVASRPAPADFALGSEAFADDPDAALYRLAVAAALVFGPEAERAPAIFAALDTSGALEALYEGTRVDVPVQVDANALMTASVVARRVAETPDLASALERADDAGAAFDLLEGAFGRGLFTLELFWMVRALATIGVIRRDGVEAFAALPDRGVRDTLFRLGFIDTPYARDAAALRDAAAAASAFGPGAGDLLTAFAAAAGCAYGCPHTRRCGLPCRERADEG